MANIKGKVKTLAMVKNVVNVKNCTNFGCMAIDGKKAWGLKTASGNEYSVVHYCSDVNDKVSLRYTTPKGLLGHGNCMTCSNSNLLFGVSNGLNGENYIVRVPRGFKGNWDRKVIFKSEKKIPALAFYSNYHYLIRVGDSPENQRARFGIRVLEGQNTANPTVKYDSSNEFYINTKWTYKHVQDIHYEPSKGLLFQTMNDSTLTISKIAVYDLNGSYTTYNGKKMFSPKDMITFDMHNTHTKYEVESLGLDEDGYIVMACNIHLKTESNETDAFQRVTNVKY